MRPMVIIASAVFWMAMFYCVISLISNDVVNGLTLLTVSFFWLRFELVMAHGVQNRVKSGDNQ